MRYKVLGFRELGIGKKVRCTSLIRESPYSKFRVPSFNRRVLDGKFRVPSFNRRVLDGTFRVPSFNRRVLNSKFRVPEEFSSFVLSAAHVFNKKIYLPCSPFGVRLSSPSKPHVEACSPCLFSSHLYLCFFFLLLFLREGENPRGASRSDLDAK